MLEQIVQALLEDVSNHVLRLVSHVSYETASEITSDVDLRGLNI